MGRAERASPAELAGISYRAWVVGICVALAIGFIFGMVIAGAHAQASPLEQALVCKPVTCVEDEIVFIPRAIVVHNAEVAQKMVDRIRELEKVQDELLRAAKRVCA